MNLKAPRGTRDILPPASEVWDYVETRIKKIYRKRNFLEIRTPIFEETDLFVRGVGDTTDIVEKEMYTFNDKGGRSITLRPEGTAPVVRAYIENKLYGKPQPFKLFYFGPMFRYERPQAGRFRQHYQTGVEVIGGDSPLIDAEVIALGNDILREFSMDNWKLHLNSIGCRECRPVYIEKLKEFFRNETVCRDCSDRIDRNPLRVLDCKSGECAALKNRTPSILDYLCPACSEHFAQVQQLLETLEIPFELDHTLVRGLDYYSRTAFEFKTRELGAQDTIIGGGRYDGLSELLGGPSSPGMGFGLGLDRFILMLENNRLGNLETNPLEVFMVTIGEENVQKEGWRIMARVRKAGFSADMDLLQRSPKNQMKAANRIGARFTVILGEDELKQGVVQLKDMYEGTQSEVRIEELIHALEKKTGEGN